MRDFFSLEGPFNKWGGILADMVLVTFMWILFSIPIITIGASTTAMYFVTTRRIAERERYITTDFWESFKANFKRATIMWMIILVITVVLVLNVLHISSPYGEGLMGRTVMFSGQLVFLTVVGIMSVYIYPLMARFDMGLKEVLKSAFFMSVRHFLTSLTCVAMVILAVFLFVQLPPLLIVLPGAYAWGSSIFIMRVFKKYRPEMDKDPAQEIAEIEAQKAEDRWRRAFEAGEETTDAEETDEA